jgi:hypothetical protein
MFNIFIWLPNLFLVTTIFNVFNNPDYPFKNSYHCKFPTLKLENNLALPIDFFNIIIRLIILLIIIIMKKINFNTKNDNVSLRLAHKIYDIGIGAFRKTSLLVTSSFFSSISVLNWLQQNKKKIASRSVSLPRVWFSFFFTKL